MLQFTVRLVADESPDEVLVERRGEVLDLKDAAVHVERWVTTSITGHHLQAQARGSTITFRGPRSYVGDEDVHRQLGSIFDKALEGV